MRAYVQQLSAKHFLFDLGNGIPGSSLRICLEPLRPNKS